MSNCKLLKKSSFQSEGFFFVITNFLKFFRETKGYIFLYSNKGINKTEYVPCMPITMKNQIISAIAICLSLAACQSQQEINAHIGLPTQLKSQMPIKDTYKINATKS